MAIDLNSDLGELIGDEPVSLDEKLLKIVSSANVACGGHAGDDASMARVCAIAAERKVAVGAHVSFVDREGFGRKVTAVDVAQLREQLIEQIGRLDTIANAAGTAVTYVKAHGELYHASVRDPESAEALVGATLAYSADVNRKLAILTLAGSSLLALANEFGLLSYGEAFADRAYLPNGSLVPRSEPNAVITEPMEAVARLKRLLRDHEILAVNGASISVKARSICIHGDTPGAVEIARRIKAAIVTDRVRLRPFAPPPKR